MKVIHKKLHTTIHSTSDWGMDPEWIESAGFAYLAKLRMRSERLLLKKSTGSKSKVLLGAVYAPSS